MGKKGNGEGSIYEHKRNGKKIGYREAYTVHLQRGRSVATSPARYERKCAGSSRRRCPTEAVGSFSMPRPDAGGVSGSAAQGVGEGHSASEYV